jgi:vitamin B12 transporter
MTVRTTRILFAAALATTHPLLAQTSDRPTTNERPAAAPDTIERVIVTGARVPIDVSRLGSATTVITRDEIERRQARYLTDLLRAVPGFAVSQSGGLGSQTQSRVRGGEANHVLVLIDGVRANDPASSDEFRWEHYATGGIERVEIVRGPQSALWGSEAIGAVVNVITRTGSNDPTLDGYAEAGSYGTRNIGANAGGRLGGFTFGGSIESLQTDGTNISRTGTEDDGASVDAAAVHLRYDGSDRVALDAMLRASDATSEFDPVDFAVTGLPTDGNLESRSDNLVGGIRASIQGSGVVWHVDAEYFDSTQRNLVDDAWDSSTASQRLTYGVGADVSLGDNELSLALEHEDIDFEQRGAVVFGDPNQSQEMQVLSAIAEYRWLAGDRISLILSGRYDSHSDFDDALTGRVSATYRLHEATRLRAGIGTGQKTPTFIDRFGFFPEQFVGNPDLKPESSLSYDLGLDREFRDGAVSLSASLYWQELDDEIDGFVFDPGTFLFTAENESTVSKRRGLELGADWRLGDAFRLGLDYGYTDATEPRPGGGTARELRRPRHSGGVSLAYDAPGGRFSATFVADHGGERDDTFFPPFPEPEQRVTLGDYTLVDATARFRLRPSLTLFARATNLLDEDYEQVYGYATPGRAAYVGLRADLGR